MNTEIDTSFSPTFFKGLPELELPTLTDIIEESPSSLKDTRVTTVGGSVSHVAFDVATEVAKGQVNAVSRREEQGRTSQQLDQVLLDFSNLPSLDFSGGSIMDELSLDTVFGAPLQEEAVYTRGVMLKSDSENVTMPNILGQQMYTQSKQDPEPAPHPLAIESGRELRSSVDNMAESLPDHSPISIIKVASGGVKAREQQAASASRRLPIALFNDTVLVEALYQTVLPRMKAEVSVWLHSTLESHVKQMMTEVLHRFEQDCDQWFSTTLRDTLNQAIDNLRREEQQS